MEKCRSARERKGHHIGRNGRCDANAETEAFGTVFFGQPIDMHVLIATSIFESRSGEDPRSRNNLGSVRTLVCHTPRSLLAIDGVA